MVLDNGSSRNKKLMMVVMTGLMAALVCVGSALRITGGQHQMVTVQESPLEEKKRLLKQAIEKQDFEQAAVLRDEIKEMESHD